MSTCMLTTQLVNLSLWRYCFHQQTYLFVQTVQKVNGAAGRLADFANAVFHHQDLADNILRLPIVKQKLNRDRRPQIEYKLDPSNLIKTLSIGFRPPSE